MILVLDGDEVQEYLRYLAGHICKQETILRPQESGPCVHIDSADDDDPDVVRALGLACRHPDGACPHLDAPDVLCSVRDACYAMREVARLRETCEAEQEEQDRSDPARAQRQAWTPGEDAAIQAAANSAAAWEAYRGAFPQSDRTPAAISSRWYRIRETPAEPGEPLSREPEGGPEAEPRHPWLGMRVRIVDPKSGLQGRTGTVLDHSHDPGELLVELDDDPGLVWIVPESLALVGAGEGSP